MIIDRSARTHGWSLGDRIKAPAATALVMVAIIVGWQIAAQEKLVRASLLPSPTVILQALLVEIPGPSFWSNTSATLVELASSLLISITLGTAVGILFWRWDSLGRIFEPYMVAFYAVPVVVFYPITIVLIGLNQWPIILLASLSATIPVTLNAWHGLRRIRRVYLLLGTSLRCSRRQTATKILLPAAGPLFFTGLKVGAIYALVTTIAMEFIIGRVGLGYQMRYLFEIFDNDRMYAYMAAVLLLSIALTIILEVSERWALRTT